MNKLLLGILAVALALRLWGIADRLPDPTLGVDPFLGNTAVDEGDRRAMHVAWEMWRGGTKPLDLNPRTGEWPGLPFYLTLELQLLYRAYDLVAHGSSSAGEFAERMSHDPAPMFLLARLANALIGVLTVWLVYLIGKRLRGPALGVIAALLLALNPFHILSSQRVSDPNLLALLFVLLATHALVASGRPRLWLAGAMIGLAAACKYVPMVLLAIVVLAGFEREESESEEEPRRLRFDGKGAVAAVLAAGIAFFVASPFTLLDWGTESRSVVLQQGRLLSEWVGLSESSVSLPTYLTRTFPAMLGWPAYLLSIVGSVLLFPRRRGWVVALVPPLLLLPTGFLALAQERFMLPAMGSLLIGGAYALVRFPTRWKAATGAALALCVAWPAPAYLRTRDALHRPDTRVLAHRWIEATIPRTEPLAVDVYGPEFDAEREGRLSLVWPFLATQTRFVRGAYHPEWLDGIRYYASSGEVERRFRAAAERYPEEAAFHDWLRAHGTVVWTSDSTSGSGPRIEIRALPDSVSTRAQRDALWNEVVGSRMYSPRIARWCAALASVFLKRDQYARAEEWASRGLMIQDDLSRRDLLETLSFAQVRLGRAGAAEATARAGLKEFPGSQLLHVVRAMALEGLSRKADAIVEYGEALRRSDNEAAAQVMRAQIQRLEGSGR